MAVVDVLVAHWRDFGRGMVATVLLVCGSFVVALVVGALIATLRGAPSRVSRAVGRVYVELFRNTPLLVLLAVSFVGLRRVGVPVNPWAAAIGSLGLYTAAYVAEALRSGFFAVNQGQVDAATSLGLDRRRTMLLVVLPQAFRLVLPPLGNLAVTMIKNSAAVGLSALGIADLLAQGRQIQAESFQTNATFLWTAVGYLSLTLLATAAVRWAERRRLVQ